MTHTVHYVCKYTPLELLAAMGAECVYANHMPDGFGVSEQLLGSNICGFGKAITDQCMEGKIQELVLTGCCDTMRSVSDLLERKASLSWFYLLELPHTGAQCSIERLASSLKDLAASYEAYSGNHFDREKFIEALKVSKAQQVRPSSPYIALLGGRAGTELHRLCLQEMPLPVFNETCAAGRTCGEGMPAEEELRSMDFDRLMLWYAGDLLSQLPCMRMIDREGRKRLYNDPNLKGIIYHTIRFCDFYSFEYAQIRKNVSVPLVKIDSDYTKAAGGQLSTRLQAFAEEVRSTYKGSPEIFKGKSEKDKKEKKLTGSYFAGIDSGSASTDVVILDRNRKVKAGIVIPTGAGARISAEKALSLALEKAGLLAADIALSVATGYGRNSIAGAGRNITEITCHAKGAHFLDPSIRTVIDIGGQDSKVIVLDEKGNVKNFVMNDKCAAGTGRFLDMMARTMEMDIKDMAKLGIDYKQDITISSTCTVFAESEVVSLIADNVSTGDIIHGLDKAIAGRTASLAARAGGTGPYMMTGGVSFNQGVVYALEKKLGEKIEVSDMAQLCGALGAALCAIESAA